MLGLLGLAAVGAGVAYYVLGQRGEKASAGEHGASAPAGEHGEHGEGSSAEGMIVDAIHPKAGGIRRTTTQAGSVHSFEYASLYAKVSGYLKTQGVDIGDEVKQGQLLAVIEDPEIDKAVDQNLASLEQANARVHVAEQEIASAKADKEAADAMVQQQQTEVAAKESNRDLQHKQLDRIAGLVARRAVEAKLQDEQQDRFDVATADLGVAKAMVLTAKAESIAKAALVGKAEADLLEAKANVAIAQANLEKAKVMQDYTKIVSPYDGVVTLRSFHRGDFIRSASEGGTVPLLAVARTDKVRIVMPIPDVDVPYLDRGDAASFQIVALPGQEFKGVITRYADTEDPQSRNMRTEIDMENPDGKLREGMYGRVTVVLQEAGKSGMTVPSSSLISQNNKGEGAVFAIKDGKAHKVDVHVDKDNGVEAEIHGGVGPQDLVVFNYKGSLSDGVTVTPNARSQMPQPSH